MSIKRNRSVNWDEEEKQLFRSVLKEYTEIIEDKRLSTNSNKLKTKAWEEVHKKFNSINSRKRDLNQLKIQWKGMKVHARRTYGQFKKDMNITGGGTRPATPDEAVLEIKDLLNPAELLQDHNIYDSDGIILNPPQKQVDANDICALPVLEDVSNVATEGILIEMDTEVPIHQLSESIDDSISATPLYTNKEDIKAKKKFVRKLFKTTGKSALKSRKDHEYINEITTHSKSLKEREFNRRMEMAEEKHALEINNLKEKHALEIEILKENLKHANLMREITEKKLQH